jgi:ribosome-associated protein
MKEVTQLTMAIRSEDVRPVAGLVDPSRSPGEMLDSATVLKAVLASLEDSKAEDIVSIDIQGKSSLGDAMVVASGRSHRHVGAIADRLLQDLKEKGLHDMRVEGLPHCDWVLVDAGDVLVHVFRPEVRGFYNLEKMWSAEPAAPRSQA